MAIEESSNNPGGWEQGRTYGRNQSRIKPLDVVKARSEFRNAIKAASERATDLPTKPFTGRLLSCPICR